MSLRTKAGYEDRRKVLSRAGGVWLAKPAKPNLQDERKTLSKSSCISLVPLNLQINDVRSPSANSAFVLLYVSFQQWYPWRERLGKFYI